MPVQRPDADWFKQRYYGHSEHYYDDNFDGKRGANAGPDFMNRHPIYAAAGVPLLRGQAVAAVGPPFFGGGDFQRMAEYGGATRFSKRLASIHILPSC